jgi:signal peptidase I
VALPELPDDRRAQPRRYGPADPAAPSRSSAADDRPTEILPITAAAATTSEPAATSTAAEPELSGSDPRPVGRRRRQLGSSPGERPASTYRAPSAPGRAARAGRRRRPSFWRELPILIVVALALTFLIQTFLAKVYVIPSGSMETTLHGCSGCVNDRVLVDKVIYRFRDPMPGDVVVFRGPDTWTNSEFTVEETANPVLRALQGLGSLVGLAPPDEKDFVKRVIAVGGQTIACCDPRNRVLVDGQPLDEPYIYYLPEAGTPRQTQFGPVTVPDGELWMMGDSRNNSADSRVPGHGGVPLDNVIGQARFIVMPFSRFDDIPSIDPHTAAVGMAADLPAGAPAALGLLGVLPWLHRSRRHRDDPFLPVLAGRPRGPEGGTGRGPRTRDVV